MKTIFTLILATGFSLAFAQTKTTPATTTPAPTTTATTPAQPQLSAKAKTLCKEWKLSATETWDLRQDPSTAQKGDLLNLMENGRYRLIMDGSAEGGTWTVDASNKWITLKNDIGGEKKFQVLSQTDTELKVDYRDADGTHNVLIYSFGTAASTTPAKK